MQPVTESLFFREKQQLGKISEHLHTFLVDLMEEGQDMPLSAYNLCFDRSTPENVCVLTPLSKLLQYVHKQQARCDVCMFVWAPAGKG